MATPPRVTRAEVAAAIERIHWRHAKVDHPSRSGLSDDPAHVLEHLSRHSTTLPQWVRGHDALDGLVLHTWLWWEDRRRERALLRRGLATGLTHRELGAPLGISTRQGLRDRLDRLDALLAHDRPDEKLTRAARAEAAHRDERASWIVEHEPRIRAVLDSLLREIARVPELTPLLVAGPAAPEDTETDVIETDVIETDVIETDVIETDLTEADAIEVGDTDTGDGHGGPADDAAEWLAELRADLQAEQLSPATLGVLGLALAPLRILIRDLELDPGHGLSRAVRAAERLRTSVTA